MNHHYIINKYADLCHIPANTTHLYINCYIDFEHYQDILLSLPRIQSLSCNYCKLTVLPRLPDSILSIQCDSNSLTTLPQLPRQLQKLICYGNPLRTLPLLPHSLTLINHGYRPIQYNCLNIQQMLLLQAVIIKKRKAAMCPRIILTLSRFLITDMIRLICKEILLMEQI